MKGLLTGLRDALGRVLHLHPRQTVQLEVPRERLGSGDGVYCICPEGLGADSVVYSFGLGLDISFDLACIERFGVTLHAFDPTPRSIEWVKRRNPPAAFVLHELGLADYDGVARFTPPENPEHISHTLLPRSRSSRPPIEVQVRRLETVMRELGHERIDVLKMDVEGAEYGIIDHLVGGPVRPRQVLLEFHHHLRGVPLSRTERAISQLDGAGYRIFHVSDSGRELSFLRP